jgi:O-antigen ligase
VQIGRKAAVPDKTKTVRLVLAVVLAVTPLALMNGVFLSHDVIPKAILILTGAAWVLFLLPRWMPALTGFWGQREGRLFLYLVIGQWISLTLSTAVSSQPALSLAGTVWRRFGLVEQTAALVIATGIACLAAARPAWTTPLFRAVILCGGVAALYGTLQYFGIDPFLSPELYTEKFLGSVVRPPATMGNGIYFSAWLVPIALLAASSAETETLKIWTWICGGVALLACLAIMLAGSRGAVLAVAGGGLVLVFPGGGRKRIFSPGVAAVAALLAAMALALALSPAGGNFRRRLVQWRGDIGGTRLGVWRDSPALIREHPLLGTGPETFATEFRLIESPALSRAYPDFYHETPHNAFLDAASAQGVTGALILGGVFWLGLRRLRGPGLPRGLQAAVLGILIASLFASLTLVMSMYLWTLAGLGAAISGDAPDMPAESRSGYAGFWRIPAIAAGAIFLAAAISLGVEDRAYAQLQDGVDGRNFAQASNAYAVATDFSVGTPGYELWSSREFATLGRSLGNSPEGTDAWRKAREAAALAEKKSEEHFSAAYQSSVLAVAAGDLTRAESKAREAIAMAPNWYKPHLLLGQILQAMGRNAEAAKEMEISRDLGWRGN